MKLIEENKIESNDLKKENKEEKEQDFDIEALIKFGRVEKVIEVIPGVKIRMHTLEEEQRRQAFALVQRSESDSLLFKLEEIKVPLLTYAIEEINGEKFDTPEKKQKLYQILSKLQSLLLDKIYLEFSKLEREQLEIFEKGIKKN